MNDDTQKEQGTVSRSAKKRAAKTVEDLAVRLVELGGADFRRLPLEGDIARELKEARTITAHGARKRQIKHLAGLLRKDPESLEKAEDFVTAIEQGHHQDAELFHFLEELRERLCDPERRDAALEEVRQNLPAVDNAKVRRLAESVQNNEDKRAFRELFKVLKAGKS